jgi:outer membrane usher protein
MLGSRGALNFSVSRTRQGSQSGNSAFLTWTWTLSERRAVVVSANGGSGVGSPANELYASYVQNPPPGPGAGWRVGASSAGNYEAQWRAQATPGDLQLQAARYQGVTGQSADWSGAAIWMDGEFRAARSVRSSFAVVEVADLADVPVYVDHQLVAHTDAHGRALLPWLLPYEANRINIEPVDLPLDTQVATRTLELAPAYRSGVLVRFPVNRVRAGSFRLVLPGGAPVPAGALMRFGGAEFPVGYDGASYVTGYDHGMAGSASWSAGQCRFRLDPPPPDDPQPDLGTVTCRPVQAREATP